MGPVALWPRHQRSIASWNRLRGLVIQEQNFAPLCDKLLLELVTLESGSSVALESEKVDSQL